MSKSPLLPLSFSSLIDFQKVYEQFSRLCHVKLLFVPLYAYAGFPRSLNALSAFMGVLDERKAKGIKDVPGKVSINMRWRICFEWNDGHAYNVEITDYH